MFDEFNEPAIRLVVRAQDESRRLRHANVDLVHFLLAMSTYRINWRGQTVNEPSQFASVLETAGLKCADAREQLEATASSGKSFGRGDEGNFSPNASALLQRSKVYRDELKQKLVAPEHLCLAMLDLSDSPELKLLQECGMDCEKLRSIAIASAEHLPAHLIPAYERQQAQERIPDSWVEKLRLALYPVPVERFTSAVKQAIAQAQNESQTRGHRFVGTEHLLIGLIRQESGLASKVLNVQLDHAHNALIAIAGKKPSGVNRSLEPLLFTARAMKTLMQASQEAAQLGMGFIDTEHVLLALLSDLDSGAKQIMRLLGVEAERLRPRIHRIVQRLYFSKSPIARADISAFALSASKQRIDDERIDALPHKWKASWDKLQIPQALGVFSLKETCIVWFSLTSTCEIDKCGLHESASTKIFNDSALKVVQDAAPYVELVGLPTVPEYFYAKFQFSLIDEALIEAFKDESGVSIELEPGFCNLLQPIEFFDRLFFREVVEDHLELHTIAGRQLADCPFHGGIFTGGRTLVFEFEQGAFRCSECGIMGDIVAFVQNIKKSDAETAVKYLDVKLREFKKSYEPD